MPNDQYGRPIKERSNIERYLSNPTTGISRGFYAPLDLPFSLFGSTKEYAGPLSDEDKSERKRLGAASKELAKKMRMNRMKAEPKSKPKPKIEIPGIGKNVPPVKKALPKSENDKKKSTGKLLGK